MAARLTDRQKKKIVADYMQIGSYNAVAKINGVSRQTVKNIVEANGQIGQKLQEKKEENTVEIVAYMESQKALVCEIIGKGLAELAKPEKLEAATMSQITTALGTLIDKWGLAKESGPGTTREDDPLTKSLREEAEGMERANQ